MASFLESLPNLDLHGSIIDCNWYYGCLFGSEKKIDIDAILFAGVGSMDGAHIDGNGKHHRKGKDERSRHSFGQNHAKNEQKKFREESDFDADDEAECLASMFRVLDEDGDGRVSVDEIVRYLERLGLGMAKEEVGLVVRSVSACEDDFLTAIEFDEFYRIIFADQGEEVDNVKGSEDQAICEAFHVFDQNGDGLISAMELADVLCILGFVEGRDVNCCKSMIESVDYNGDGFVDIHEFKHLITRNSSTEVKFCTTHNMLRNPLPYSVI